LPEIIVDFIEEGMPNAPEKSKTYAGNNWKEHKLGNPGYIDSVQQNWLNQMERMFPDQIQLPRATHSPVAARTVEPYDASAVRITPRATYDDETIEQNKKIAFVADNIKQAWAKPAGTWRKTFMKALKALSKAGVPSEKVEVVKEYINEQMLGEWRTYWGRYNELFSWLNDEPTNYELIKGDDIDNAYQTAMDDLENREDPDNILHTFEDGSYWYNLQVSNCSIEGERMGHCGSDSRGVLVSLRKRQGKRKASSSYVTMTYSEYENTVYQIKGRSNDAPDEKTWDHIAWFINNMRVENVEETGEHSGDQEGIQEMIEYLSQETNANFHGSIEDRLEKAEDYCAGVLDRYTDNRDELEYGDVGYNLEEEMNDIYCYASARYEFEIDLGWPDYSTTDMFYIADNPQDFKEIPRDYSGLRAFVEELGIDDMIYDMPGDDGDWDISLRKLVSAQPEGDEIDPDREATVHLVISLHSNQNFTADEDGEVPDFDEFVDVMLAFEEDDAPTYKEQIRQNLAAGGYTAKSTYDRSREELMKLTNLDKWHVKQDKGGLEFDWTADDGQPLHSYTGKFDSARAQMYGTGTGNRMGVNPDAVFAEIFGYGPRFNFANMRGTNDYSVQFARELSSAITTHLKSKASAPGQQKLDFGDKYGDANPTMVLADDTDFVIFQDVNYRPDGSRERYPLIKIKWLYRMRVNPQSPPEEFEIIQEIAAFLNENEELVTAAADKIIAMALEDHSEKINKRRDKVMSNQEIQDLINRGIETYGRIDADGSAGEVANRIVTILQWFEANYSDMGEAERYIMVAKFLIPIVQNNFRSYSDMGQIDRNTGAPVMFDELVPHQVASMGGQPVKMVTRNESVEDQISRIDKLLNEIDPGYDLRTYKVTIDVSLSKDVGGQLQDTQTEIRGIEGVTTVRTMGDTKRVGNSTVGSFEIKFELMGSVSRQRYKDRVLLPALTRIRGLRVLRIGNINSADRTPLNELSLPFGGVAGALGAVRYGSGPVRTPSLSVQQVADDWAASGVMDYDRPMANANMQYHVMVDTEELLPYLSRVYRNPKDAFDADYQYFIKNGAENPVYVAVGKNGRVRITGNEDVVWFAKKAGLEQVPVFFSYQMQV